MLTGGRAVVTEAAIRKWFRDIQAYTVEEEQAADLLQAPEQIFNFDESNILLARKKGNVLGPVNYKSFLQTSKENDINLMNAFFSAEQMASGNCTVTNGREEREIEGMERGMKGMEERERMEGRMDGEEGIGGGG